MKLQALCHLVLIVIALLASSSTGFANDESATRSTPSESETAALQVVARRIDGYNAHDVATYLSAHHPRVQIYEYPDKHIGSGRAHLERLFGPLLEQGIGHIKVVHQAVVGSTVISEEYVNYGGSGVQHIVAIYTISEGLITVVRLVEAD